MFEAHIDRTQLANLTKDIQLSQRKLLSLATKVFKMSAKDFSKKVIKRVNTEQKISQKKLKQRIKQFVINDLRIKIFSGFYRVGITNWNAKQVGKRKKNKKQKSSRGGVEFGAPGFRQFRQGAFIVHSKKKDGTAGRKVAFKRMGKEPLPIEKQVADINYVVEPVLIDEVDNFYSIFSARFNKEVEKVLNKG